MCPACAQVWQKLANTNATRQQQAGETTAPSSAGEIVFMQPVHDQDDGVRELIV
jgi:hypothetical protein